MSGGGQNTVVQNSQPPSAVMNAYQGIINQAQGVAGQPLQQYSGPMVAGFSPMQQQAFQQVANYSTAAQPWINAATQYAGIGAAPVWPNIPGTGSNFAPTLSTYMSPYTQQVANATAAQMQNQFAQQNQNVVGNAIKAGAWGGDRAAVAQAELANQQDLAFGQTMGQIYQQGYGQALGELNQQQQLALNAQESDAWRAAGAAYALGNLGAQAQSEGLSGASSLLQSGALQQQLQQEQYNIPYEQFIQQQAYPFQTTGWEAGLVEGAGGGMGGMGSTTSPGASMLGQIGGLGMTGLGVYNMGANAGWWGAGAGAANDALAASSLAEASPYIAEAGAAGYSTAGALAAGTAAVKRGGRIHGFDDGGPVTLGGALPSLPDYRTGYVPGTIASPHGGIGIPNAPAPYQESDPLTAGIANLNLSSTLDKLGKTPSTERRGGPVHLATGGAPIGFYGSPGYGVALPQFILGTPSGGGLGTPAPSSLGALPANLTSAFSAPPTSSLPFNTFPNTFAQPLNVPPPSAPAMPSNSPASVVGNFSTADTAVVDPYGAYNAGAGARRGGRIGHDSAGGAVTLGSSGFGFDEGGAVEEAGLASSGFPTSPTNPNTQGLLQRYMQMPLQQLQNLAMRVPPGSPQGAIIQRALMAKRMQPSSFSQGYATPAGSATLATPMGARRGGAMGFDDGGATPMPLINPGFVDWLGQIGYDPDYTAPPVPRPGDTTPPPRTDDFPDSLAAPKPAAGFSPVTSAAAAEPGSSPFALAPRSSQDVGVSVTDENGVPLPGRKPTLATPYRHAPAGVPLPAGAPATAGSSLPTAPATLGTSTPTDYHPAETPSTYSSLADNPWTMLAVAGAGMMASRNPHALGALGEGLLTATQYGEKQIGHEEAAKKLAQEAEATRARIAAETEHTNVERGRLAEESRYHTLQAGYEERRAAAQERSAAAMDAWRMAEAGQGTWQSGTGPDPTDPSKTVSGAYFLPRTGGEPQFHAGKDLTGALNGRGGGSTAALAHELVNSGSAKDLPTALEMIRDPTGKGAKTIAAAQERLAQTAAKADPDFQSDPVATLNKWRGYYSIGEAPGGPLAGSGNPKLDNALFGSP